jgi:hypothetical protein
MAKKRKPSKKKPVAKRQRKSSAKQKITPVEEILFRVEGKMSTFGGPKDTGMSADEGLALFTQADLQDPKYANLFLSTPPPGTTGLGRRLSPDKYYFACRWNYNDTPREFLKRALARVIRWLLQEHQIPRTNIFGHDFTPGYSRPGGTSCPDKLFGPLHSQATIVAWVAANV